MFHLHADMFISFVAVSICFWKKTIILGTLPFLYSVLWDVWPKMKKMSLFADKLGAIWWTISITDDLDCRSPTTWTGDQRALMNSVHLRIRSRLLKATPTNIMNMDLPRLEARHVGMSNPVFNAIDEFDFNPPLLWLVWKVLFHAYKLVDPRLTIRNKQFLWTNQAKSSKIVCP